MYLPVRYTVDELVDEIISLCLSGVCRPCLVDVVPVKNEEGVVIMFILNFQELLDPSLKKGGIKQRMTHALQAGLCVSVSLFKSYSSPFCYTTL